MPLVPLHDVRARRAAAQRGVRAHAAQHGGPHPHLRRAAVVPVRAGQSRCEGGGEADSGWGRGREGEGVEEGVGRVWGEVGGAVLVGKVDRVFWGEGCGTLERGGWRLGLTCSGVVWRFFDTLEGNERLK